MIPFPLLALGLIGAAWAITRQKNDAGSSADSGTGQDNPPTSGNEPAPDLTPPRDDSPAPAPGIPDFPPEDTQPAPTDIGMANDVQQALYASGYSAVFQEAANNYDVPLDVLASVAYQESRINPDVADGDNGTSFGMFQLHEGGALTDLGITPAQARDPNQAPFFGAQFLQMKYRQHGDNWHDAVRAYNGSGPAAEQYATAVMRNAGLA